MSFVNENVKVDRILRRGKEDSERLYGIMLIDKPYGLTSHDVVSAVRKGLGIKKVGHAGTLDPMATGLLIMLLGCYTKRSVQFSNYDKEYEAELHLGISTETGDTEGKVIKKCDNKCEYPQYRIVRYC